MKQEEKYCLQNPKIRHNETIFSFEFDEKLFDRSDTNYSSKNDQKFIEKPVLNRSINLTFDHSKIHIKQNTCSQFSGIPTSWSVKLFKQIEHCSSICVVVSVDVEISVVGFMSCSRLRARVVFKKWRKKMSMGDFHYLRHPYWCPRRTKSFVNERQILFSKEKKGKVTWARRRYFLGCSPSFEFDICRPSSSSFIWNLSRTFFLNQIISTIDMTHVERKREKIPTNRRSLENFSRFYLFISEHWRYLLFHPLSEAFDQSHLFSILLRRCRSLTKRQEMTYFGWVARHCQRIELL